MSVSEAWSFGDPGGDALIYEILPSGSAYVVPGMLLVSGIEV